MKQLLTIDLTSRTALNGGSSWTPPTIAFGESLTLALRFQQQVDGNTVEPTLDVRALRASVGNIDARPAGGKFSIKIGSAAQSAANTTAQLPSNVTAADLAAAINGLSGNTYGTVQVAAVNGSYLMAFGTGAVQVPITVVNNILYPVSVGRVSAWQVNSQWVHELRLTQTPVAFSDSSARVVPNPPTITEVQAGGSNDDVTWNEIQALYVPPDFRGNYQLKMGYSRTSLLSSSDGPDQIQSALAALGDGFAVTNPLPFTANIEFINTFAGSAQSLLEVVASNAPPGDLTFSLDFTSSELQAMLRGNASVTLPFELRLSIADENNVVTEIVAFSTSVSVTRPVWFDDLATVPAIDWLQPPSPKDYVPFDPSQVITGQQFFQAVIGNGSATSFTIAHGLNTEAVFVFARENADGGRQLVQGVDFSVVINSANQVTVTALTGAPASNAWAAFVMSAQTVAAFASGLSVTIAQVTGLQTQLDSLGGSVSSILSLLPTVTPASPTGSTGTTDAIDVTIPDTALLFPGRNLPAVQGGKVDPATLPRPAILPPAIHEATVNALTIPLPAVSDSGQPGNVFQNQSGSPVFIPQGMGHKGTYLAANGYAADDGRIWYPVNRAGSTNSYFPADMEQELFMFEINDQMLRAATTFTLDFKLALQMFNGTSRAQYMLVVEWGDVPSDSSPSPTSTNLQNVVWNATPMLSQRLIFSGVQMTHHFGVSVVRDATGATLTGNKLLYAWWYAADSTPDSANFAIRARLINFDTENSITDARGTILASLSSGTAKVA